MESFNTWFPLLALVNSGYTVKIRFFFFIWNNRCKCIQPSVIYLARSICTITINLAISDMTDDVRRHRDGTDILYIYFLFLHKMLLKRGCYVMWEWRRTCSAGLYTSNEWVMKEWQRFMNWKVSGKKCRGRSRLTFENTVSKILEEGHVKSMRRPQRACMKRLMTVYEAKEVCRDRSVWHSVLMTTPL